MILVLWTFRNLQGFLTTIAFLRLRGIMATTSHCVTNGFEKAALTSSCFGFSSLPTPLFRLNCRFRHLSLQSTLPSPGFPLQLVRVQYAPFEITTPFGLSAYDNAFDHGQSSHYDWARSFWWPIIFEIFICCMFLPRSLLEVRLKTELQIINTMFLTFLKLESKEVYSLSYSSLCTILWFIFCVLMLIYLIGIKYYHIVPRCASALVSAWIPCRAVNR